MRRILLLISAVVFLVALILLLNFTAPNPTGRRYSSAMPVLSGTPNEIGASAEYILAEDLGLLKNGVNFGGVIPDFIDDFYVVESKNCAALPCESRGQFERLVELASSSGRELWIYTRIDTPIPNDMAQIVQTTGGQIIGYFTVPGYVDTVDHASIIALIAGSGSLVFVGAWEIMVIRKNSGNFPVMDKTKLSAVLNDTRTRLLIAIGALIALVSFLDTNGVRSGLATVQSLAAIVFYLLGGYWLLKHRNR